MTILDEIAAKTRKRIAEKKMEISMEMIKSQAEAMPINTGFPFEQALKRQGMSLICEVKKASPSKGLIAPEFPYVQIAKESMELHPQTGVQHASSRSAKL